MTQPVKKESDKSRKDKATEVVDEKKERKITHAYKRKELPLLLGRTMDRLNFKDTQEKLGPEWRCYLFSDRGDNLRDAIAMGYHFIQNDDEGGLILIDEPKKMGDNITRHTGTDEKGNSVLGYLMACPMEIYKKRFAAEQAKITDREKLIKRKQEGQYEQGELG